MSVKRSRLSILLPLILSVALVLGMVLGALISQNRMKQSLFNLPKQDKLTALINFIEMEYVDTISKSSLVELTIPSLLNNLDPHSMYMPASEIQRINEPLEGNFDGIGVQFNMLNDTVVVIQTISGGPSERLGIIAGDRIITINDTVVAGKQLPNTEIVNKLRGRSGTSVRVGISRQNIPGLMEFVITRDKIPLYSVDVSYMINAETGYIKISQFAKSTFREYMEAVEKLQSLGMKKLIIDLRGNGGGYLDAATNIADQFLHENSLIVYTEGKAKPRANLFASSRGVNLDTDVIVLIDEWSASASEILAGAIQDNDRGLIVGRRSYGKGLVQTQTMFTDGSGVRLTVARYYTPSGRSIQKPYDRGNEQYFSDLYERYSHGEFFEPDSIRLNDSVKFFTPSGRVLYGGGGIMPDIFLPGDTTDITPYYTQITRQGLVYRFAFDYADKQRNVLVQYPDAVTLENYLNTQDLLEKFVKFAQKEGVKRNEQHVAKSGRIIHTQLKANIARNILDNPGFYPIIQSIDNTLLKSIELISDENFPHKFFVFQADN
jgi:carboxyl-terminal processing protease